jgi:two-component system, OmpR family, phosphate regulon sensor histidine kinase PhoR
MLSKRLKNPVFLIYVLVIYITLQFSWWLYLIYSLYTETYKDTETLGKKTLMLLGEGSVFMIILLMGVYFILRSYRRERDLIKQQENFILSVSHELKTPIASVKLFLQTLKKRSLNEEKKEEIYERSLTEMNRLNDLVNNILLTRSIENDNYFIDPQKAALDEFILDRVAVLEKTILKEHQLDYQLNSVAFPIDPIGFERVLINLLENAAKYSPAGSTISVILKDEPEHVHLEIQDQGIGLPADRRELVFQKFYREENEMTRKSKGTGLGLYITRYLVEQHDGEIRFRQNSPAGLIAEIRLLKK